MEKLSYVHTPSNASYMYQTIPERVRCLATEEPNFPAFISYDNAGKRRAFTRQELYEQSVSLANNLTELGVEKDAMVGVCMNNSMNMLYAIFGVAFSGGIPFFLSTNLKDGSDLKDTMNDMKSKFLIIDAEESDVNWNLLDKIWSLDMDKSEQIPSLKKIICNGTKIQEGSVKSRISLEKLLKPSSKETVKLPIPLPEDPAVCFCTSGSTGKPKVVIASHFSLLNYTVDFDARNEITKGTAYFCDRQFSWAVGFPRGYIADGCTRVFVDTRMSLFGQHIERLCEIIETEKCTTVYVPGYLGVDLLRNEQLAPKFINVNVMLTAGERFNTAFVKLKGTFCKKLLACYGNTEGGFLITFHSDDSAEYEEGIAGIPLAGVEAKIVDDEGKVVLRGAPGDLYVRSMSKFSGYQGNADLSREAVDYLGWFHTGDIAHIRPDGVIVIDGRIKELITMQTVKYFPWDIEKELKKCPGVKLAFAVGVPDARLTEVVCACVVPDEGVDFTEEKLKTFCDDTFLEESTSAGLSLKPKYHLVFETLPLTTSGKIDRRRIGIIAKERLGL